MNNKIGGTLMALDKNSVLLGTAKKIAKEPKKTKEHVKDLAEQKDEVKEEITELATLAKKKLKK
jgi:hypothetical protein